MKITVYTTNNYPHYEKQVLKVRGAKKATEKANEISNEILRKIQNGELQDGQVEVSYK